jgi:HNH endonuclease
MAKRKKGRPGWWRKKGEILPQHVNADGHAFVVLEKDGDWVVKLVHELVAETHVPNPDGKKRVRHKNGNILDNRASNLEWY